VTDDRFPEMRPDRDAAIRAMLIEHVRDAPARSAARRRRRWWAIGAAGVLTAAIGATAGAVVLDATRVSNDELVHCMSSDTRAPDGGYPGVAATVASDDQVGRVDDAIALCEQMWLEGRFGPDYDPLAVTNPPGQIPASFQVCVMPDESAVVVPSDDLAVCSRLGLAPLDEPSD
jgi:hypothetical protein